MGQFHPYFFHSLFENGLWRASIQSIESARELLRYESKLIILMSTFSREIVKERQWIVSNYITISRQWKCFEDSVFGQPTKQSFFLWSKQWNHQTFLWNAACVMWFLCASACIFVFILLNLRSVQIENPFICHTCRHKKAANFVSS